MKKIPFKVRPCAQCGLPKPAGEFAPTTSPFFPDSHLSICDSCLNSSAVEEKGDWQFVDRVCQWADIAFIPEKWTQLWNSNQSVALSQYLRLFQRTSQEAIDWKIYQDKWKAAIEEGKITELHPVFDKKELERMRTDWGPTYTPSELKKLDSLYDGISKAFGISNKLNEQDGRQLCKLSLAIDKCIDEDGAVGVDKLVSSYNKLRDGAGFTNDKATDANNFGSISELAYYLEKTGWNHKFHNDEIKDVVDSTIKNIQNYNARLYRNESSIGDQIEERIKNIQKVQDLENMSFEDETLDLFDDEGYKVDEEEEDFNLDI